MDQKLLRRNTMQLFEQTPVMDQCYGTIFCRLRKIVIFFRFQPDPFRQIQDLFPAIGWKTLFGFAGFRDPQQQLLVKQHRSGRRDRRLTQQGHDLQHGLQKTLGIRNRDPRIKPRSPTLQAEGLISEPPGQTPTQGKTPQDTY